METVRKKMKHAMLLTGETIVGLVFLFELYVLARIYLFASCVIPTHSMFPTLIEGDYIIVSLRIPGRRVWEEDKSGNLSVRRKEGKRQVKAGDVVVFNFPYVKDKEHMDLNHEVFYCKRCVGVPGEEYCEELWNGEKRYVYLPASGDKLVLDRNNLNDYRSCIEYETRKDIVLREDTILLGDSIIHDYRFRHDYYYMCGDNVSDSYDSRFWGLLPDDFILGVGKFIWFSKDPENGKIRWERIFTAL